MYLFVHACMYACMHVCVHFVCVCTCIAAVPFLYVISLYLQQNILLDTNSNIFMHKCSYVQFNFPPINFAMIRNHYVYT